MSDLVTTFPTQYSSPDTQALLERIQKDYEIGIPKRVFFWSRGLNDTYMIDSERGNFVLRLYRRWRSEDDVTYELEWLSYLKERQACVVASIPNRAGRLFGSLSAPEGVRHYALFPYLESTRVTRMDRNCAGVFGRSLAEIHLASDGFHSDAARFELDVEHILDAPLRAIESSLKRFDKQVRAYRDICKTIRPSLQPLSRAAPAFGPCHGDVHFENLVFADGQPCWLDFDSGGMGWRMYDVATFYWALKWKWPRWGVDYVESDDTVWKAFVEAYTSVRPLSADDWELFPAFVLARYVWAVGLQAANADDWAAFSWLDEPYLDQQVKLIQACAEELSFPANT